MYITFFTALNLFLPAELSVFEDAGFVHVCARSSKSFNTPIRVTLTTRDGTGMTLNLMYIYSHEQDSCHLHLFLFLIWPQHQTPKFPR